MMLLDECFLLQFIHITNNRDSVDMGNVLRNHQIGYVKLDLFLLENQLPFPVLKLIFKREKFNDGSSMEEMIITLGMQLIDKFKEPSHAFPLPLAVTSHRRVRREQGGCVGSRESDSARTRAAT